MDKQYDKRIKRTRRRPESGNTHRFTQNDTKKIFNWKTPGHDGIHSFWFKKFTSIHDRLARQTSTRNEQMPTRSTCARMDDQRKDHIDPKRPKQRNRPKQLQIHNLPTDYVENIDSTNKRRD